MTKTKRSIKVLVVDDHPFTREGIRTSLSCHGRFTVVGEAADGHEALRRAGELAPDVIVMDVVMPGLDGLQATRALRLTRPQIKVVLFSCQQTADFLRDAVRSGARGCLSKNSSPADLVSALRAVQRGQLCFQPGLAQGFSGRQVAAGRNAATRHSKRLSNPGAGGTDVGLFCSPRPSPRSSVRFSLPIRFLS